MNYLCKLWTTLHGYINFSNRFTQISQILNPLKLEIPMLLTQINAIFCLNQKEKFK